MIEINNIYNEDCLVGMKRINDKSVDMILCDLPYGRTQNKWDSIIPFESLWEQYNRIIKDNGAIVLFADGLFMADLMSSNRKMWKYNLIWNKVLTSGFLNANRQPLRQHEEICVFYKKQPTYNPQFTEGKPLHGMGTKFKKGNLGNNNYSNFKSHKNPSADREGDTKKYPKSIISFQKPHPSKMLHPTEKSIECCEWLIRTFTNENEIVLDNCIGVGTTAIACIKTNRQFIGFETNIDYYFKALDRINRAGNILP